MATQNQIDDVEGKRALLAQGALGEENSEAKETESEDWHWETREG